MTFWTGIVFSDAHIPHENKEATDCLISAINYVKPDGIVMLGDIGDFSTFCSHDVKKYPKKTWNETVFFQESQYEFDRLNEFLDLIHKASPKSKSIYAYGNHEDWVRQYIVGNPKARQGAFEIENRLYLKKRKIIQRDYNKPFRLGKLCLLHGMYHNQHHAQKHLSVFSRSVMYGHVHDFQTFSRTTYDNDSHMAWSLPCLCDMNPVYLKTKANNWGHGFAIVHVLKGGNFQVTMVRIQDGKCIINNKLI